MIITIILVIYTLLRSNKKNCSKPDCKSPLRTQNDNLSKNSKATYWSFDSSVVLPVTSCLSLQSIWKCFNINVNYFEDVSRCFKIDVMTLKMFHDQREWLSYMLIALTWPPSCASAQSLTKRFPSAVVSEKVIISAISTFELSPYDMRQPSFAGQSTFANVWESAFVDTYIQNPSLHVGCSLFSHINKYLLSRIMPITLATLQGAALVALDRVWRAWRDLPCHVFRLRNLSHQEKGKVISYAVALQQRKWKLWYWQQLSITESDNIMTDNISSTSPAEVQSSLQRLPWQLQ